MINIFWVKKKSLTCLEALKSDTPIFFHLPSVGRLSQLWRAKIPLDSLQRMTWLMVFLLWVPIKRAALNVSFRAFGVPPKKRGSLGSPEKNPRGKVSGNLMIGYLGYFQNTMTITVDHEGK